ncbi:anti-repressor SinI family protein [Priestia aryabhattai]|nr:anti-repressor SinI family protein [Priestia aryabhattai]MDC7767131.1 anti-repressor SinI family protein [Priestia aryabhattai]UPK52822.1 anti-repressor SinI family protein [Bacillus sp. H8-1]WKG33428.1 anti-repressor SinI family protein [Priestia aryabhattai]
MKNPIAVLPEEWLKLVKEAMNSNVSKEEFKQFVEGKSQNNTTTKNIR